LKAWLLKRYCNFLEIKWNWLAFLCLQLIYPLYVLSVGLLATFSGYQWKGRKYGIGC
jgi:biofilm PGA synthesis N-glycosyltransferase PgaC